MTLSHVDEEGRIKMVGVGHKSDTERVAMARGEVRMKPETLRLIVEGEAPKGDVLTTAQIAGILAAKRTHTLIPLCHPLPLTEIAVDFEVDKSTSRIKITARARCTAKTGVEMEALTAVSIAALTIYDMAKAVEKTMRIGDIHLVRKTGGKSEDWSEKEAEQKTDNGAQEIKRGSGVADAEEGEQRMQHRRSSVEEGQEERDSGGGRVGKDERIHVRVKFFAAPREALGTDEVDLKMPAGSTVQDLIDTLDDKYPVLTSYTRFLTVAVNRAYVGMQTELHDGDEVACLPPVGGG